MKKVEALENWQQSTLFSETERIALEYAEAVTLRSNAIDDDLIQRLKRQFDEDTIVELTALIAFQNLSSKFNSALGVPARILPDPGEQGPRGSRSADPLEDDVVVMNDTKSLGAASAETSASKPSEQIELRIGGMTCPHCPPAIEKAIAAVPGVTSARVNLASNTARIRYERARTKLAEVLQAIRSLGYVPGTATLRIPIKNMHCSSCSIRIELALQMTPGVVHARASLGPNAVDIEYQPETVNFDAIRKRSSQPVIVWPSLSSKIERPARSGRGGE